ncbi:MAG: hypothetical protein IT438_09160 [Phycisphaerales bacterium]|nr:hypothetical protein [Phycisphaerales bacterium]
MSRTASNYTIGSPTRRCAATDRELLTGEGFVAALLQNRENEEFVRLDFSSDAWPAGRSPQRSLIPENHALLGSWRGLVPEPGAKRRMLVDDASLVEMFEQSDVPGEDEGDDRTREAFRYLLALILLRKKLLVCEKTTAGSMYVRARGAPKPSEGGELIEVVDPKLDGATIERVSTRLAAVMEG